MIFPELLICLFTIAKPISVTNRDRICRMIRFYYIAVREVQVITHQASKIVNTCSGRYFAAKKGNQKHGKNKKIKQPHIIQVCQ
jgi:hypothetical protein